MKTFISQIGAFSKTSGIQMILKGCLLGMICSPISCTKFVQVPPPTTQLVSQNVFTSDATAISTIVGTYSSMISGSGFASGGSGSISFLCGLSSDELINYSPDPNIAAFYTNALTSTNSVSGTSLWNQCYNIIYTSNAILEGLAASTGVSDSTKKQLEGEARFIRAFCNFYLVNLYGNIPLISSTNYQQNGLSSRIGTSIVYDSIVADLKTAQSLLPGDYHVSGGERIRPNKWAATAMLARVYLYLHNWSDAETQSTSVIINSSLYSLLPDLNTVFLKNSMEAIWQLMPVLPDYNTNDGQLFILTSYPNNAAISQSLINSFEAGDTRRTNWTDSIIIGSQIFYFPYKYKIKTGQDLEEYSMVLRLAEQYLIRAEARAQLNDLNGSAADLNTIRARAGLAGLNSSDPFVLLQAILHERQVELNTEWGHRWLDLKRTGIADVVLGALKSPGWQSTDTLYPIPKSDLITDPNLTQNPGY